VNNTIPGSAVAPSALSSYWSRDSIRDVLVFKCRPISQFSLFADNQSCAKNGFIDSFISLVQPCDITTRQRDHSRRL
jgi:hypothetical protein